MKLGQVTSSAYTPVGLKSTNKLETGKVHTKWIRLSKKTIYLLIRIYKAVADVTECHSGFEKGSLGHKTGLPSHNIKLI